MKAVIFREFGEVDRLEYTDMEEPVVKAGEVKIRVEACALNHLDIWVRLGGRPVSIPMPHISGNDVAGVVVELGEGVRKPEKGMRVIVNPGISCGNCEYCFSNNDSACGQFKVVGFQVQGGYAEYITVPARNCIPVTDRLTPEAWSSIPLVFLTAWHMLFTRAGLRCVETVLVQAGGSGVGIAAIQLAKLSGARVITTVGTAAKAEAAKELGADDTILYRETDFVTETLRITNGRGVDVVFDHIGGETFTRSLQALVRTGRLVNCGVTAGNEVKVNLQHLYAKQHTLLGSYLGSLNELKTVIRLAEEGKVRPVVDKIFPLSEARAAQQRMLNRENFGKIVLKI